MLSLEKLTLGNLKHVVLTTCKQKHGRANRLVDWSSVDKSLLMLACELMPVDHLRIIFAKLMFDLAHNRTGFS